MAMPNLQSLMNKSLDDKILADVPVNDGRTVPTGRHTGTGVEIREGLQDDRDPDRSQLSAEFELPDNIHVFGDMSMDRPKKANSKGKFVDFKLILYKNLADSLKCTEKTFADVYGAFKGTKFTLDIEEYAICKVSDIPKEHSYYREFVKNGKKADDKVYPTIESTDHKLRTHLAGCEGARVKNRVKGIRLA